jgi:hypothetical protein
VHLGYGTYICLSVSKLPLKCSVVSLYSVVIQPLNSNTVELCNCLIQFLLTMVRGHHFQQFFVSAQRLSEHTVLGPTRCTVYLQVISINNLYMFLALICSLSGGTDYSNWYILVCIKSADS